LRTSRFVDMTGIPRQDLIGFAPSCLYSSQEMEFLRQQIDVAFEPDTTVSAFVLPRRAAGSFARHHQFPTLQNSGSRFGIVTFTAFRNRCEPNRNSAPSTLRFKSVRLEIEEDLRLAARVQNQPRTKIAGLGHHERGRLI